MENYLTIDEINSNAIFAPIGEEQAFKRRIMNDDFKSKPKREHLITYLQNRKYEDYYINFYKQFNFAGTIKKTLSHNWGGNGYPQDKITLKDYKKLFRELKIKSPKGAKKEWYMEAWIKSF